MNSFRKKSADCQLCHGRPQPFIVRDSVWQFYIPAKQRHLNICLPCWQRIVQQRDQSAYQAEHGLPAGWPKGYPLPPGGYAELFKMSEPQRDEFFARARHMPGFQWLVKKVWRS